MSWRRRPGAGKSPIAALILAGLLADGGGLLEALKALLRRGAPQARTKETLLGDAPRRDRASARGDHAGGRHARLVQPLRLRGRSVIVRTAVGALSARRGERVAGVVAIALAAPGTG